MNISYRFIAAAKASGAHLLLSIAVAALAAVLVFGLWYPFPYRDLMGGRELFLLVIAVDVVCGPLLTFVLYNPSKRRVELMRDLGLVMLIQVAALLYGLHTVMVIRPVYLVFEVDRFNAISAFDVNSEDLSKAKTPFNVLPFWGPQVIAARAPKDGNEKMQSIELSIKGSEPSERPDWWQPLDASRATVLTRAQAIDTLRKRHSGKPLALAQIDIAIKQSGAPENTLRWLPLTSRRSKDWTVLIDSHTAVPMAYVAVDGF